MKRILASFLCLCMLLSILPANVFAATMIFGSEITVTAPEVGEKPIDYALFLNPKIEASKVEWIGELDANGCFMAGKSYTVKIYARIVPGGDSFFVQKDGSSFRVNKSNKTVMSDISADGQQALEKTVDFDIKSAVFSFKSVYRWNKSISWMKSALQMKSLAADKTTDLISSEAGG